MDILLELVELPPKTIDLKEKVVAEVVKKKAKESDGELRTTVILLVIVDTRDKSESDSAGARSSIALITLDRHKDAEMAGIVTSLDIETSLLPKLDRTPSLALP